MKKTQNGIYLDLCHGRCCYGYGMCHDVLPIQFNSRDFDYVKNFGKFERCLKKFRVPVLLRYRGMLFSFLPFFNSFGRLAQVQIQIEIFILTKKTEQPSHLTLFGSGPLRHPRWALCIYFSSQILHQKTSSPLSNIWLSGSFVFERATLYTPPCTNQSLWKNLRDCFH